MTQTNKNPDTTEMENLLNEDYKETNGVLTFKQGELEKDIAIEIIDDDEPEEDEMFIVKLSNPSSNARIGSEGMTIVTIIDDDGA